MRRAHVHVVWRHDIPRPQTSFAESRTGAARRGAFEDMALHSYMDHTGRDASSPAIE